MSAASPKSSRLTLSGEFRLQGEPSTVAAVGVADRRVKPRIIQPFPTKVRGEDVTGEIFEIECTVDNISSTGVYLRIPRKVLRGNELDLVIKFDSGQGTGATARLVCQVLRNEPHADGLYGLAMGINHYRFL